MILLNHTGLVPLLSDTQSDQIDLLGTLAQNQSVVRVCVCMKMEKVQGH